MVVLRSEFEVNLIQLGELGTIQFAFFGLGAFPAGWLVDRIGSRWVMLLYFIGLIFSSAVISLSASFTQLAIGLGLLGLFSGLYHPSGLNLISRTRRLSQNMGYHGISGSIGLTAGPLLGGIISGLWDWRLAYLIPGAAAVFGAFYTFFKIEPDHPQKSGTHHTPFRLNSAHWIIFVVSALWGFAHHGLFNFLPLYFTESVAWDIDPGTKGGLLTAFVLILGVAGQMAGGRLGAAVPRVKLFPWVVGLNIPLLIVMGFTDGIPLILIVGLLGAVNFTYQPVNNSLIADFTRSGSRGMVYGISSGLGFGVGSLAATAGGYVGEYLDLNLIFPLLSIVLLPAVLLSFMLMRMKAFQ